MTLQSKLKTSGLRQLILTLILVTIASAGASAQQTNTFPETGNAGVGTTTPAYPLTIQSAPSADPFVQGYFQSTSTSFPYGGVAVDGNGQSHIRFMLGGTLKWQWRVGAGTAVDDLRAYSWTLGADVMTLKNSGSVGIGTTNPGNYRLNVSGPFQGAAGYTSYIADGLFGATAVPSRINTYNFNGGILFGYEDLGLGDYSPRVGLQQTFDATHSPSITTTKASIGLVRNGNITIRGGASHTEFFRIDNSGNVGIGTITPNPTYRLDVNGEINATGLRINGTPISGGAQWAGSGSIYYNGGNVGIGTTNPGRPLVVAADASGIPLRVYRNVNNIGYGTGINWAFNNNAGNVTDYAYVNSSIVSNSAGSENGTLGFFTVKAGTLTQQAIIDQNGNVGIGTTNPSQKLEIYNATGPTYFKATSGSAGTYLGTDGTNSYIQAVSPNQKIFLSRSDASVLFTADTSTGNVGIGKTDPQYKLDVVGDIKASGTIHAKYQDLAEWVPSSEQLLAGTVVVLDTTRSNQVVSSTVRYDTRVAGVISAQPGITLGESGEGKVLVATTGRVRVKVDASRGPIQIGDLLVTSDVLGVAMKSDAVNLGGIQIHRPGTIIGKALEPLAKGQGEILVLLSLQ